MRICCQTTGLKICLNIPIRIGIMILGLLYVLTIKNAFIRQLVL